MSRSNRACPVLINDTVRYQQVNGRVASAASMPGHTGYGIISDGPGWSGQCGGDLVELNGLDFPADAAPVAPAPSVLRAHHDRKPVTGAVPSPLMADNPGARTSFTAHADVSIEDLVSGDTGS